MVVISTGAVAAVELRDEEQATEDCVPTAEGNPPHSKVLAAVLLVAGQAAC
jgi:hypothetical protein